MNQTREGSSTFYQHKSEKIHKVDNPIASPNIEQVEAESFTDEDTFYEERLETEIDDTYRLVDTTEEFVETFSPDDEH